MVLTGLKLRCCRDCLPFWWLWNRLAVLMSSSLCGLLAFLVHPASIFQASGDWSGPAAITSVWHAPPPSLFRVQDLVLTSGPPGWCRMCSCRSFIQFTAVHCSVVWLCRSLLICLWTGIWIVFSFGHHKEYCRESSNPCLSEHWRWGVPKSGIARS